VSFFKAFASRRVGLQAAIGFGAGMPFLLSQSTLLTWMTTEGVNLKTVGAYSLVSLPYQLKFVWAPFVDRYRLPFLGRRRGWMLLFQILVAGALVALGLQDPRGDLVGLALVAFAVACLGASVEIVADAYRTDVLPPAERGSGTALYTSGYRIASQIVGGGGALLVAHRFGWPAVYFAAAALVLVTTIATAVAPEPAARIAPPTSLADAVWRPFQDFFKRPGAALLLLFVLLYKFGDSFAQVMLQPFLIRGVGFTLAQIGVYSQIIGVVATIAGAVVGGGLVARFGIRRSLFVFGPLATLANVLYAVLAVAGKSVPLFVLAATADGFCGGLGSATFIAFMMSLCNKSFSATQYALLQSASNLGGKVVAAFSGVLVATWGWALFFVFTAVMILPALLVLWLIPRATAFPDEAPARLARPRPNDGEAATQASPV
jgi:MFS transporter, PAT family, beta-lactamase induction signal transducer AmpG